MVKGNRDSSRVIETERGKGKRWCRRGKGKGDSEKREGKEIEGRE